MYFIMDLMSWGDNINQDFTVVMCKKVQWKEISQDEV